MDCFRGFPACGWPYRSINSSIYYDRESMERISEDTVRVRLKSSRTSGSPGFSTSSVKIDCSKKACFPESIIRQDRTGEVTKRSEATRWIPVKPNTPIKLLYLIVCL
ncbi:MAG: hypothetical protein GTN70_01085 [Deltaproteobacteria bacterium]|nr:hypothetical protein [Deltaproteobacteria bacterium]NIS76246.1 hypothetical protein [Deltaproteobacteria bacterium]